jgi:hypothetical protein
MFIVIQKIQVKKPNKNGAYKIFKVDQLSISYDGVTKTHYYYNADYEAGRFDRPHREAYKISVHQSYRENGKVKTKQCVLGTIGYYAIAEDWGLYDYVSSGLDRAAKIFEDTEGLYDLVEAKFAPLEKRIQKEFHSTEEYKTVHERDKAQKRYQKTKAAFAKKYGVDADEYDYCYDIFGHVMNPDYLEEIIKRANAYSSYSNSSYSNYSSGSNSNNQQDYSSYLNSNSSNYTDDEKQTLKRFYKKLAMEFHPDRNPDTDTTKEMQLINKLKDEWNL